MKNWILFLCFGTGVLCVGAQDTFSIVAADSTTREVGSAGASCVDLIAFGIADASFLGDLIPDVGAINTQAAYLSGNQDNARTRMNAGDSPQQIIDWLVANDVQNNPNTRQYGIVGFSGSSVSAAGHTGGNCMDYKNHITGHVGGIYYAIQGNILLGQEVLDSMEQRFVTAEGDLACRLMAALQGANMVGADTRCASDGTSSLFAFVKVSQPTDSYANPSLKVTVRTADNSGIEPIDSLQTLFDVAHSCTISGLNAPNAATKLSLFPNPATEFVKVVASPELVGEAYTVSDHLGRVVLSGEVSAPTFDLDIKMLTPGVYVVLVDKQSPLRFVKQ